MKKNISIIKSRKFHIQKTSNKSIAHSIITIPTSFILMLHIISIQHLFLLYFILRIYTTHIKYIGNTIQCSSNQSRVIVVLLLYSLTLIPIPMQYFPKYNINFNPTTHILSCPYLTQLKVGIQVAFWYGWRRKELSDWRGFRVYELE